MSGDPLPQTTIYDAQAFALEGDLQLPLRAVITPQAFVDLPKKGGYLSERARDYRLEGVISFRSAYTQVAGNRDPKPGHGYVTLATAVLEDFNILDVVTADRVVAQVSTEHPLDGDVPTVTFLGTRFDNLRIARPPRPYRSRCKFPRREAGQRCSLVHQQRFPRSRRRSARPHPPPNESSRGDCRAIQSTSVESRSPGVDRMFSGPARGGFLPGANLWPRDRHSALRQGLSGDRPPGGDPGSG